MDGQPPEIVASDFALAGMQPDPKLDTKVLGGVHERLRTTDGSGGSLEADDEAIAAEWRPCGPSCPFPYHLFQ